MNKLTKKILAKAIVDTGGMVTAVARSLGISRGSVYNYMKNWNLSCVDAREKLKDEAEICIREAIVTHKNWNAAKWYLDRQATERGYGTQITLKVPIEDDRPYNPLSEDDFKEKYGITEVKTLQ